MRAPSVCAAILLAASGTSHAWVPAAERAFEPAAGFVAPGARVFEVARDAPAGWQGTRDRATGVLTQLWGGHVAVPGALGSAAIAEAAARAFLAQHLHLLAPGSAPGTASVELRDLVTVTNRVDGRHRTIAFQQTWRGLRVVGGQVYVVFANDRLFAVGAQLQPGVDPAVPPHRPAATTGAATWVRAHTRRDVTARATGERVVLPVMRTGGRRTYRVAHVLDVRGTRGPEQWDVYTELDGTPIARVSRLRYAIGELQYDVGIRRPTGARAPYSIPDTAITVDGAAVTTANDGSFTWPGTAAATVEPGLVGAAVQLLNEAGVLATAQLTAQPGQPVIWSQAADELGDAQLSAYVHVAIGKARAKQLLPSLTWLDQPLETHVNNAATCNAMSTGSALHFYRAGPTCENTARLADVVYHELAHAVHFQALIPGVGAYQASLSEGLSDFFAANLVDDQGVGRGFAFDDAPVREIDPPGYERVWPDDRDPSAHVTGMIISGALWDLRKVLIAQLGEPQGIAAAEAVYVGVVQRAADIPGSYLAALIADDDDGDLGNGTPHGCAIETAFGKHGLAAPGFQTTTVGAPAVDGLTISVPVRVPTGTACAPPQVTSIRIDWRVEGGAAGTVALTPTTTVEGATWSGAIPTLPDHTVVRYAVTAELDDLSSVRYPRNLADPEYQLYVGTPLPVWCDTFDDDPQWAQRGPASWDWGVPGSGAASGDPIAAFTGTHVLGTNVGGEGRYPRGAATAIDSPVISVAAYDQVRLHYRRWLTSEDATYDQATIAVNAVPIWTNLARPGAPLAHLDREWRFHDLDLTPHVRDGAVQLTWELISDDLREHGGWTLDDVCVVGLGKHAVCGDGVVDDDESCDDGNVIGEDGCSAACIDEDQVGCCSTGRRDPAAVIALGLLALIVARRRRGRNRAHVPG